MKTLISRSDYTRLTAGLTKTEREQFDRAFDVYPGIDPTGRLDRAFQDRIGARFEELLHQHQHAERVVQGAYACIRRGGCPPPHHVTYPGGSFTIIDETHVFWNWPKRAGKASAVRAPAPVLPWTEVEPGVWWAPLETPPPAQQMDSWLASLPARPAPPRREPGLLGDLAYGRPADFLERHARWAWAWTAWASDSPRTVWARREQTDNHDRHDRHTPDRFWLNRVVNGRPARRIAWTPGPRVDQPDGLRKWVRRLYEQTPIAPPRRIETGELAYAAMEAAAERRLSGRGGGKDVADVAALAARYAGIPIVLNSDLPATVWQLIDLETGEVVTEGTAGVDPAEFQRIAREAAAQMADESSPPLLLGGG